MFVFDAERLEIKHILFEVLLMARFELHRFKLINYFAMHVIVMHMAPTASVMNSHPFAPPSTSILILNDMGLGYYVCMR